LRPKDTGRNKGPRKEDEDEEIRCSELLYNLHEKTKRVANETNTSLSRVFA